MPPFGQGDRARWKREGSEAAITMERALDLRTDRVDARSSTDVEQIRDVLAHLYDPGYLQSHPLARERVRHITRPRANPGRDFRDLLLEAIEELRPAANLPADSPPWRTYQILSFRYVEALGVPTILKKLAISRSAFFRDHRRAIEAVAVLLRECRGHEQDPSVPDETRSIHAIPPLPVPLTSFIGRDRELADLQGLFGSTRLLTLTGAGGCGKTRLALRFAAELVETYPDGVWLVDLAALTDPALVPGAVATAFAVRESIGQPIQATLVSWLRSRQVLLK